MTSKPSSKRPHREACEHCWRRRERGPVCIDQSSWPIVVLTAGPDIDGQAAAFCRIEQCKQLLARDERFALVIDARNGTRAKGKDPVREWMATFDEATMKKIAGVALLIPSSIGRFMITAALLVMRQPVPYKVFEGLDEAKAWARKMTATAAHSDATS
jgi:hypothetical protein